MYPTISYFLKEVFGLNIPLPIQTYGFFFAVALLMSAWIYSLEYKRKEREGLLIPFYIDKKIGEAPTAGFILWTFLLTFIIGFKLVESVIFYNDFVKNPQEMILSSRGNFWGGLIFAIAITGYSFWKKNKQKLDKPKIERVETLPHNIIGNMFVVVGLFGILGAKIFDIIQPQNFKDFLQDPLGSLLSFSGLTFYGGLLGGFVAGVIYVRKYNINLIHSFDAFAPAAALGYGIGRMACHFSGDGCWGRINEAPKPSFIPDWAWASKYPHGVSISMSDTTNPGVLIDHCSGDYCYQLSHSVFPTSLYDVIMMLFFFGILWFLRKRIKIPGFIFALYLIFSGIERFLIEMIRVTHKYNIFGLHLTQAQLISIGFVVTGLGLIIYMFVNKQKFYEWGTTKIKPINIKEPDKLQQKH